MSKLIKFITDDPAILKEASIRPMKDALPDWYKDLQVYTNVASQCPVFRKYGTSTKVVPFTIKACIPVMDYLTAGYIIPWPCEAIFETITGFDEIKRIAIHTNGSRYISRNHDTCQFPHLKTDFFKVISPWFIKTPPGYSCLFFQPFYYFEARYTLLPAIVDTDTYPSKINFLGYTNQNSFKTNLNDPMIGVLPFKRVDFNSEIRNIDYQKDTKSFYDSVSLILKKCYKNKFWYKKSYR